MVTELSGAFIDIMQEEVVLILIVLDYGHWEH